MHDDRPAELRLHLLGPPGLVAGAQRWPLERKDAALLAMLALDGALPRNDAALRLWPDATVAQARTSLRQRLYRLRRSLGRDVAGGGETLRLDGDVHHELGDPTPALRADPDALPGELLAGCAYADAEALDAWLGTARERWNRRRAEALAALAEEHEAGGHLAVALRYAQRLVQQEPLLEHAHRRLMRLHYLRGDRAAALAAYERCRKVLSEELDTAPDAETLALLRLVESARSEVALARPPVATLRPPRLIGRDVELAQARQALAAGRVLVVQGEAGIGKTRLLEDLCAASPQHLLTGARAGDARLPHALLARLVRAGQALPAAPGEPALEPWVQQALAALLPELGPAPARLDSLRLHQAVARLIEHWHAGGLQAIAIDDLHHADPASVEALLALFAARPLPGWALGLRPAEAPSAFDAWCAAVEPGTVETLALQPLDEAGVQALLASLGLPGLDAAAWAGPLRAHSGGNPLFILETLRTAIARPDGLNERLPMPGAIGALIDARLARLSPAAMRLARVAALAGQSFSAQLATEVLGCHPVDIVEPWAELERALVMQGDAFAHDLIADSVLRGVPRPVARLLHARLADALVQQGAAPAAVAHHRMGAEQWAAAAGAYNAAALQAQGASRRADEAVLREQAAAAFEHAGQRDAAFDARCDAVEAVLIVRGIEAALALTQQLADSAGNARQRARAGVAQAQTHLMAGDPARGLGLARDALLLARTLGDGRLDIEASRLLAIGLAQSARYDEALATLAPLQGRIDAHGTAPERQRFWSDFAYVLNAAGQLRRTVEALDRAIAIARQLGDHAELATLTANLATAEGNFGRPARALQHAQAALALTDPIGRTDGTTGGMITMTVAQYCVPLGRFREAVAGLERAVAFFERDGQALWATVARGHLVRAFLDLGQHARALQLLDNPAAAALSVPQVVARRLTLLARCRRLLGHSDPAALAEAFGVLGDSGHLQITLLARLERASAPAAEHARAAADDCAAVAERARACEYLGVVTTAQVLEARCRWLAGELAAAQALAAGALERIEQHAPTDLYLPEAWWTLHGVLRAAGDTGPADEALRRARRWVLETALPEVPEPFRDSFLHRNEVNRALLAAARERWGPPGGAGPVG
jgi:DNA-binding SARP family transcriptional activator